MSFATEELKSDRKAEKGLHASELMASILPCVKGYSYTSPLPQMVPKITTAHLRLVLFLPQCASSQQFKSKGSHSFLTPKEKKPFGSAGIKAVISSAPSG